MVFHNSSVCFKIFLFLLILTLPSDALCAREDTAYLSLRKTAVSKGKTHTYIVKKGDTVSNIIWIKLGAKHKDVYRILKIVKRLNPKIKNINTIYPGQALLLPGKDILETMKRGKSAIGKGFVGGTTKVKAKPFIPRKNYLPVIRHVINRLDGSVTTAGNYYIPIPPAGQVTVSCSMVPVVELDDGSKILLDFTSRIPEDFKKMIESTWKNYSIVRSTKGLFFLIEKIISKSKAYSFGKFGKYLEIGENPKIEILLDWMISSKISADGKQYLHGLNVVKDRSQLLPRSIKKYAKKNGLTITEIITGSGLASTTDENYPDPYFCTINSITNRELANSLLTTLGYTPTKNVEVKIFESTRDGFDMSVKADLLFKIKDENVIINFRKLSQQFTNIFRKRGTRIIFISEREQKKTVVQKVLYAMNIPFSSNDFKFSIPERASKPRMTIHLPATKIVRNKSFIYIADFDMDREIYRLLNRKWGVNLVKY
mgnify:CR=1 FL=1